VYQTKHKHPGVIWATDEKQSFPGAIFKIKSWQSTVILWQWSELTCQ